MKLLSQADLNVVRIRHTGSTHYFISATELRKVRGKVGDGAYILYSYYRTGFFQESNDLEDDVVGEALGYGIRAVQKYRKILEDANLFRKIRHGTKAIGVTQVFVGEDIVALHDAGLPPQITDSKAFTKLKKKFNIKDSDSLIKHIPVIVAEYEQNPDLYK